MSGEYRDVKWLFRCDFTKNLECSKTSCYSRGGECTCTTNPQYSTDGKILWPCFKVGPSGHVGCEVCPLGAEACAGFRRGTPNGECPCDVFDTYTDYMRAEEGTNDGY